MEHSQKLFLWVYLFLLKYYTFPYKTYTVHYILRKDIESSIRNSCTLSQRKLRLIVSRNSDIYCWIFQTNLKFSPPPLILFLSRQKLDALKKISLVFFPSSWNVLFYVFAKNRILQQIWCAIRKNTWYTYDPLSSSTNNYIL